MLNRVVLMGRLTADPELKKTTSDLSVLSFTVAVERNYSGNKDKQTSSTALHGDRRQSLLAGTSPKAR